MFFAYLSVFNSFLYIFFIISLYFFYKNFIFFVYGIFTKEAAIIINGLASLFVVPIVVGLWRFKGFSKIDFFVFLLCVLGFVVMLIFPFKKIMFLLFSF